MSSKSAEETLDNLGPVELKSEAIKIIQKALDPHDATNTTEVLLDLPQLHILHHFHHSVSNFVCPLPTIQQQNSWDCLGTALEFSYVSKADDSLTPQSISFHDALAEIPFEALCLLWCTIWKDTTKWSKEFLALHSESGISTTLRLRSLTDSVKEIQYIISRIQIYLLEELQKLEPIHKSDLFPKEGHHLLIENESLRARLVNTERMHRNIMARHFIDMHGDASSTAIILYYEKLVQTGLDEMEILKIKYTSDLEIFNKLKFQFYNLGTLFNELNIRYQRSCAELVVAEKKIKKLGAELFDNNKKLIQTKRQKDHLEKSQDIFKTAEKQIASAIEEKRIERRDKDSANQALASANKRISEMKSEIDENSSAAKNARILQGKLDRSEYLLAAECRITAKAEEEQRARNEKWNNRVNEGLDEIKRLTKEVKQGKMGIMKVTVERDNFCAKLKETSILKDKLQDSLYKHSAQYRKMGNERKEAINSMLAWRSNDLAEQDRITKAVEFAKEQKDMEIKSLETVNQQTRLSYEDQVQDLARDNSQLREKIAMMESELAEVKGKKSSKKPWKN